MTGYRYTPLRNFARPLIKKLSHIFLVLFLTSLTVAAQNIDGAATTAAEAQKALNAFNLDNTNKTRLATAHRLARQAGTMAGNITPDRAGGEQAKAKLAGIWRTVGDVYFEIATQVTTVKQMGIGSLDELPDEPDPAFRAAEAYTNADNFAISADQKTDALKRLRNAQGSLYNFGIYAYEDKKFEMAYRNFNRVLIIHNALRSNNSESMLADTEAYNDQVYVTGLAALNANKIQPATELFQALYDAGYGKPAVYEALYKLYEKRDINRAYRYLETGRKKFPEDVSLLFAEINHFLKLKKLDELIVKLKQALAKEPDNPSLYTTLANVYENLFQKEVEAGNKEKGNEYFDAALNYYKQALEKDPDYFEAAYSIAALYFNKAAALSTELLALESDYSREGLARYEARKKEIFQMFDTALPYFKRCEKMNPNDVNTLIALKEIYARKDDLATSNIFKERLEIVQGGGKNEKSYFQ
jgi:tetratricopeptide (TPR) repeat protein